MRKVGGADKSDSMSRLGLRVVQWFESAGHVCVGLAARRLGFDPGWERIILIPRPRIYV